MTAYSLNILNARESLARTFSLVTTRIQVRNIIQNITAGVRATCAKQAKGLVGSEVSAERVAIVEAPRAHCSDSRAHLRPDVRIVIVAVEGGCIPLLILLI